MTGVEMHVLVQPFSRRLPGDGPHSPPQAGQRRRNAPRRPPKGTWKAHGNGAEARPYSIAVVHIGSGERSGADEVSYRLGIGSTRRRCLSLKMIM